MFEIKFRIINDIERLRNIDVETFDEEGGDIEGFFQINFNGNVEGYFHDGELKAGELGHELITTWFILLFDVILYFEKYSYVALPVIERYGTYYEFVCEHREIKVSLLKYVRKENDENYIITNFKEGSSYPSWKNVKIPREIFYKEIVDQAQGYLKMVNHINPNLIKGEIFSDLIEKMQKLVQLF